MSSNLHGEMRDQALPRMCRLGPVAADEYRGGGQDTQASRAVNIRHIGSERLQDAELLRMQRPLFSHTADSSSMSLGVGVVRPERHHGSSLIRRATIQGHLLIHNMKVAF